MSQIEPKKTDQSPKVGKTIPVSTVQIASDVANVRAIDFKPVAPTKLVEENNPFFHWARAGRFARLFSIKSPQSIDRQALLHQSNEALIAKLTSIDSKLEAVNGTPFQNIHKGELALGRIIVGEQIRRLRLAVAGKENRISIRPTKKDDTETPTQKVNLEGDEK